MDELERLRAMTREEHEMIAHGGGAYLVPEQAARQLSADVQQLGRILAAVMQRMEEMERERAQVTISHDQVKALLARMRERAAEICAQYALAGDKDAAAFRAAIKKAVLARHGIRDLHDLPLRALDGAEKQIDRYANIGLVMQRKKEGGA